MTAAPATVPDISPDFVADLAERAQEAEGLRRLPGAHFLDHPLQRIKRDVDVLSGHVIFDYDTSRELAGALILGMAVARTARV